ncbi:hypothetical protein [Paraburkholderia saeva]|uniref:Uncharacterized protein n=1 Tax=Paraburkholderia saeva TaxID=2777537 RepID=A0A9N8RXG3_9BURK|nr:hypothetical protein [Paraburkholderia saeva]CAG4907088.1 hypothetical protein LMG31841_03631 [Paraburkholderia saeva]CAG4920371.1 hypothetical protein R52603_04849 [Paraburkholderia saeva]CAG4926583.1 hypothetical protein R70241_05489 [Paraburkholderia saeva]
MRHVFRIDMKLTTLGAAICVSLASMTLPVDVIAQVVAPASDSSTPSVAAVTPASLDDNATDTSSVAAQTPADSGASADVGASNDLVLDDQMLSRQRGGAVGMVMVAATPQMRGGSVTLWDEIAPPTPLPVPVDAARAAQSNVASYTRK